MWAFLILAGIFSGWWGALSSAAPPAPNFAPSVSTLKNSPMTLRESLDQDQAQIGRTIPLRNQRTNWGYNTVATGTGSHLEPYRYQLQTSRRRSTRTAETDNVEAVRILHETDATKHPSTMFKQDGLPRLRYDDILDEEASIRSRYRGANLELDNFMNYQVTPTSLDGKEGDFSVRKLLENGWDYRRRNRIDEDRPESTALALYPSIDEPNLAASPHHTTQQSRFMDLWKDVSSSESSMERPRVTRAVSSGGSNQNNRKRTKANSPREQRRQSRNKERRGQNWCPDADIGNRAFLAPTVFEGKARSMSSLRKPGSNYAVTFEVKQVYKSQPGFQPLLKTDNVRLHFRDKVPGKSTLCGSDASGQMDGQSGMVRANIKRGKVYLVFVSRVGPRNFTILGEPMIRSKKNAQAVQAVIRPDYVREVKLSELRDAVARLREKVKLVCRTRGSPPPRVHWLKDGVPLHPRRGLRIQHKRRRSKVVIASARAEDSGQYECVAESTSGHRAALAAELLVTHAPETTTAAWPRQEAPCPISEDFCMNGGTCLFFETVGEPACRCAEGFTGLRCENKDVTSTGMLTGRQGTLHPKLELLARSSASKNGKNFLESRWIAAKDHSEQEIEVLVEVDAPVTTDHQLRFSTPEVPSDSNKFLKYIYLKKNTFCLVEISSEQHKCNASL